MSRCEIYIQPYYISDERISEPNELKAIEHITKMLKQHMYTRCEFLDLIVVNISERVGNEEISSAWKKLREKELFGDQYDWLACFAQNHPGIELSIHEDDKAIMLIKKYGVLIKATDSVIGEYWVLDKEKSDSGLVTLFKNYHMPLAEWTKLQMKAFYIENGYGEIMDETWFCYHPINGKPCGFCNPCMYTIEEGLRERFGSYAMLRYYCKKGVQKIHLWTLIQKIRNSVKSKRNHV